MMMSNYEIMMSYKTAKRPRQQIEILAELNGCSKKRIEKILFEDNAKELQKGKRMEATKARSQKKQQVPESVSKILMDRIEVLDGIIQDATKEYKEIVGFLGIGESHE